MSREDKFNNSKESRDAQWN